MDITYDFIKSIPKTDLHLHLDGSLRLNTLIELAKDSGVKLPSETEEGLKETVFKDKYENLGEYLQGFSYTTAVMQNPEAIERISYELVLDNIEEGVRYIEVRFAPQLHQRADFGIIDIFKSVNRGFKKAADEFNGRDEVRLGSEPPFAYGIIACAMRMFDYGFSEYFDSLLDVHKYSDRKWIFSLASQELVRASIDARDNHNIPVVGFDLAGMEEGFPAVDHKYAYNLAHKNFLKKTVHAGEAYGPESIFQAITELHADRIGHGLHLFDADKIKDDEIIDKEDYVNDLAQYIADRRITLEVCLTSNMQTNPEFKVLEDHSFKKMKDARLSVTFCTDNRTVSSTTVSDEIYKAVKTFNISHKELRDFVIYGFKRSFFPGTYLKKRKYVRRILNYYDEIEKKFNIK
ncbi:MAG: adenosine deaminase family protein [Acidobacteriota bacterium]